MDSTLRLKRTVGLNINKMAMIGKATPSWTLQKMQVDISLTKEIDKKTTSKQEMNQKTQGLLRKYTEDHRIYTDASKEKDKVGIGIYDEELNKDIAFRVTDRISITSGELIAIRKVLEMLKGLPNEYKKRICICTDSLGACMAVIGRKEKMARADIVTEIKKKYTDLKENGLDIVLIWIPSHVDIHGNEMADKSANEGLFFYIILRLIVSWGIES